MCFQAIEIWTVYGTPSKHQIGSTLPRQVLGVWQDIKLFELHLSAGKFFIQAIWRRNFRQSIEMFPAVLNFLF